MKKKVLSYVLALILVSLLPGRLFSQSQNYFVLGLWYVGAETPYPGFITPNEKSLFNGIKNTWLIGTGDARERHYMDFCNETGGQIRMPILGDCEYPELVPRAWGGYSQAPFYYTDCSGVFRYYPYQYPNSQFINDVNAWVAAVATRYNSDAGFQEYGVAHELYDNQYWQNIKYICDRIQQVNDAHNSLIVGVVSAYSNPESFFDTVTSLDIFQHEYYPILASTPFTGTGFQAALDVLVDNTAGYGRCMTIFRNRHTKWHAIIQASQIWNAPRTIVLNRLPSRSEVKVQAYLALSRGARGIEYFTYFTANNGTFSYDGHVTEGSPRASRNYGSVYGESEYRLYDVVSSLNNDLAKIGPIMMDLYPVAAFPSTNIPPDSYIKSVTGNYIDVGTFTDEKHTSDPDANLDYFMVVNRVCSRDESGNPADPQNINVTIQKQPNTKYVFREMLSGSETFVFTDANGRYTYPVTLGPGEGKLIMLRRTRTGVATANQTWHCMEYVSGDVTFNAGYTLTIVPGTTIKFTANSDDQAGGASSTRCEIIVNGTLKADYTTFTGSTKGSWYGIRYLSSASYAGWLRNCTITNADVAVYIDRRSPSIESCSIDDADNYGIYVTGSSAWPYVDDNYIEGDFACVAHYNSGNGNFLHNSFRNAQYGVYVSSGSPRYDYYNVGRNKFETSISQDKVKVFTGQPWMGMYQYFTIPNGSYKYIRNSSASTINATQNYWSAYPPSDTYFYGSVDRSNPLSSPPSNPPAGPTWSLPKSMSDNFFLAFNEASMLFWNGEYVKARESLKELTEKYLDSEYSSYALNWYMLSTEQLEAIGTQVAYLNSIKQDKSAHANTRFYAQKWLLQCEMREGTSEKAKILAAEVEPGSVYDREISFDLAVGLYYFQGDKQGAEKVLAELSEKFKDDDTAEAVEIIKNLMTTEGAVSKPIAERLGEIDEGFSVGVFPNPSNAAVKIRYVVENSGPVSLVIYNLLGQRVLTLVDRELEAGRHEALWDGKDLNGKVISSGVYLCRLETMDHFKTIKLLMTK